MSAIVNPRDILMQVAPSRLLPVTLPPNVIIPALVPDLLTPPSPTGFAVGAAISNLFVAHDSPTFVTGHGYLRTNVYGALWLGGALPVFADAVLITSFSGQVTSHATNPALVWHLWITWVSRDGVESPPAGGPNGLAATTGQDVERMVAAMTGPGNPFTVLDVDTVIDGVTYPAGTYSSKAFIFDAQINNAKIANLAVDSAKVANLAVTTAKIADAAIMTEKIGDAQITNAKIANLSVDSGKIADAAIGTAKIAAAAITTVKIDDAAITTAKIGASQITSAKIGNAEVGTLKLAGNAVTVSASASGTDKYLAVNVYVPAGEIMQLTILVQRSFTATDVIVDGILMQTIPDGRVFYGDGGSGPYLEGSQTVAMLVVPVAGGAGRTVIIALETPTGGWYEPKTLVVLGTLR